MKTNMIKTFLRDQNNSPYGVAVLINEDGKHRFGYSLVNSRSDRFNKKIGTDIAVGRAQKNPQAAPKVTSRSMKVAEAYRRLEQRANKYFKTA